MDNTLDILNEILGTLGQVKNLMENNSPQAQNPLDIQNTALNQISAGNTSEIGSVLGSLSKYINEYDESKADVALLGFEYFVDTMNKASMFNAEALANTENLAKSFNYLLSSLTTAQNFDVDFVENINKISVTFINLIKSLEKISDFNKSININLDNIKVINEILDSLSKIKSIDERGIADFVNTSRMLNSYIATIVQLDWDKLGDAFSKIPSNAIDGSKAFNNIIGSVGNILSSMKSINKISAVDKLKFKYFASNKFFNMLSIYIKGMLEVMEEINQYAEAGKIPDIKTTKSFVNASNHLTGIISSIKRISFVDIITFKMFGWLMFSAMRQYIKGMMKTLDLMTGNADVMKKKAEIANIFVTAFNGVIKGLQQLSIATVMLVGSMALTGLMIIKWWDVIWRGGLMTLAILGLSLGTLAILSKFNTEHLNSSVDALQKINMYMISLGGSVLLFMGELALIGVLQQNYGDQISTGKSALIDSLISMGLIVGIAHLVLKIPIMKDIEQTIDKLYKLQLVTIALTATAFFNSFLLYQFANYIDGKEGTILYGFTAASLILVSTMGIAVLLGKMYKNNKDEIFGSIISLAAMGLLLVEFAWVTEKLLDLGLMIDGHEKQLLTSSLFVGGLMLSMIGLIAMAGFITKTVGIGNMLIGLLAIGLSAGIVHYMTFVTLEIVNIAEKIANVSGKDLMITLGLIYGSVTGMLLLITAAGAIALVAWPAMLAGAVAIGFTALLTGGIVKLVDSIVDLSIKMDANKEEIKRAGPLFKEVMGLIGLMWKSLITMGDPDEEKQPVSSFLSKIPIMGTLFKSATTMLEGIGIAAMLGTMNVAVNLVDKILNIAQRYSKEDPMVIRTSLGDMLGIVNQFIPDLMKTLHDIDAEGLDAWKSKWWDPSTWGQGSRMGVILDAVKMTSDIMDMISKAGQMKIIKGFDSEGKPIYGTMMDSDIENAALKIASAMSIFVNALFTELSKVEMKDADNLKQIKKLFDGGMFSTGLIGMTNSFISSVHKLGQGWVEEDGTGKKTYRRIDINQIGDYGTNLGLAVSNFVTSLTEGMISAGDVVSNNQYKLRTFKELMVGKDIMSSGLLGTTNFLFKFIDKFMTEGTVVDDKGRVVHKSGISINDMPMYGTLLGSSVSNFVTNLTTALIQVGDNLDNTRMNRLFKFNDLMLGNKLGKQGLFTMINKIVELAEAIKKGEDYYDEDGKLHKGSGYAIEQLPVISAIIGRSLASFIEHFKISIDKIILDDNLVNKSEKAVTILIGDGSFFGGNKGLIGVLDKLIKGLDKAEINKMSSSRIKGIISNTEMFFSLVLNLTRNIQKELQALGFFTRDNVNEKALKNYEKYLITLSRIMSSKDISKLTSAMNHANTKISHELSNINTNETPKIANALSKMNNEIIGKHSARQKALSELTESLQKVGDQFERINKNSNIPAVANASKQTDTVSIKQDGQEISLSKETLNTLLAAIGNLKTDASASLSSRNIIVELNGGGEISGRLMYGDLE